MQQKIISAPTPFYPSSDGKSMAETDWHRKLLMALIQTIEHHFREHDDVYVSGDLLIYYKMGDNTKSVAPDVFVVQGVAKKQRGTYLTWEESHTPDFVLELASPSTFRHDLTGKKDLYESVLKVKEYYIYDPLHQIQPHFIGFRLVDGTYEEIAFVNERLPSSVLNLELGEHDGTLGVYDPTTEQWLAPPEERAEQAEERAEQAEERAEQEALARQRAEDELAKALATLERLQAEKDD
ncbi:MAG: Uma2 family endonuclease [Candidatus Poribacteria bacterium]|nr:Uma2 family endonuclease [Candidatus Poribacteria bacterium]